MEVQDGEMLMWHGRPLQFLHVRGHAKHHVVVSDPATKRLVIRLNYIANTPSVFTGDAFGISYRPLFRELGIKGDVLFPSSSPVDFEPAEAHK